MAVLFASGSSQLLSTTTNIITAAPFTMGMWLCPTSTGANKGVWSLADTGTTTNLWGIRSSFVGSQVFTFMSGNQTTNVGTIVSGAWTFVLYRAMATDQRRYAVINSTGQAVFGSSAVSTANSGIDTMTLGGIQTSAAAEYFDGLIGEFWIMDKDVWTGSSSPTDMTVADLFQLAYGGPFSNDRIASNLVEYISFRSSLLPSQESYHRLGQRRLDMTGTPILGRHPPLPYWFKRPTQVICNVMA